MHVKGICRADTSAFGLCDESSGADLSCNRASKAAIEAFDALFLQYAFCAFE